MTVVGNRLLKLLFMEHLVINLVIKLMALNSGLLLKVHMQICMVLVSGIEKDIKLLAGRTLLLLQLLIIQPILELLIHGSTNKLAMQVLKQ
jgi:hypothetical protein